MIDTQGLSVSDVVSVNVLLAPTAAVGRNFGSLLIVGTSPVIDATERLRDYTTLAAVASDFGTTAPEFLAAQAFFSQSPMPSHVKIGIWAQNGAPASLKGATMTPAQAATALAAIQAVTAGTFTITIGATVETLTALDFSTSANMNAVAAVIQARITPAGSCTWDGTKFIINTATATAASVITYATSPTGVDVAGLMGLKATSGGPALVAGIDPETAVKAVQVLTSMTSGWYAMTLAPTGPVLDTVYLQVAAMIEGSAPVRVFGITLSSQASYNPTSQTDLGAMLSLSNYSRTITQFSSNPYAICSFFGRALGVNFQGSKTVLTMKFKQEPGVIAELLTESQSAALTAKHINEFVRYANATAIIQEGWMANGRFWDEVHGLDWLSNQVQTDLFNVFYQSLTKIPQTDDGVHVLLTQVEATLSQAVVNGLIAPGVWNAEGFGQLSRGDLLPKGFYVYAPLIATQSQADREARKAPVLQAAIKMAGAIHSVNCIISVNR